MKRYIIPDGIWKIVRDWKYFSGRDSLERTPLMYAAEVNADADVIRMLVEAGSDVNARDRYRNTALMYVAEGKAGAEVIRMLLDAGADVMARDVDNNTALDFCGRRYRCIQDTERCLPEKGRKVIAWGG